MTKKDNTVTYKCTACNFTFTIKYNGWYPTTSCKKCGGTARYDDIESTGGGVFIKKYKDDITSLVIDKKTGQPLWLDKKGRKIRYDSPEVRYDPRRDPHGWRSTGHKVRETDKYGRRQ